MFSELAKTNIDGRTLNYVIKIIQLNFRLWDDFKKITADVIIIQNRFWHQ